MRYTHQQRSRAFALMAIPFGAIMLATALFVRELSMASRVGLGVGAVMLMGILSIFSRLTVEVSHEIKVFFGRGWPRRIIDPANVVGEQVVRTAPWYGWGVRWIPNGSMWNVWGLDAVELRLASGRVYRIGTDEPEALLAAVRSVTGR